MPDGQPPSPTPPTPPADPQGGQPPAPVPTPPPNPPAPPAGGQPPASGQPGTPPADGGKTFTQADVDRIITERLQRAEQSWQSKQDHFNQKLAELFGGKPEEADPAKLLEQQQAATKAAQDTAVEAVAQALAMRAGIKPERVETFVAVAKQAGLFANVELTAEGKSALEATLTTKANEFPEWKGSALPTASGGDRQGGGTPSLDERIAAAQKSGNWREVISLKRQKAAQQGQ